MADIKKAFLMIGIDEKDRLSAFFVGKRPAEVTLRTCTLEICLTSFWLATFTIHLMHNINKYQSQLPELMRQLKNSFYVDDLVTGATNVDAAIEFFKKSREIMAAGGINLRKWKSNSPELMKKINSMMSSQDLFGKTSHRGRG